VSKHSRLAVHRRGRLMLSRQCERFSRHRSMAGPVDYVSTQPYNRSRVKVEGGANTQNTAKNKWKIFNLKLESHCFGLNMWARKVPVFQPFPGESTLTQAPKRRSVEKDFNNCVILLGMSISLTIEWYGHFAFVTFEWVEQKIKLEELQVNFQYWNYTLGFFRNNRVIVTHVTLGMVWIRKTNFKLGLSFNPGQD
jgi:hypothetical protein